MSWYKSVSESKEVGAFDVRTGATLRVTDPCYDKGIGGSGLIRKAKGGRWIATVDYSEGDWGRRVAFLNVHHEGFRKDRTIFTGPVVEDFEVGVDSGQAGVFLDELYPDSSTGDYDDKESFYGRCCEGTLSETQAVVMKEGAVSSSGFGDGGYKAHTWWDGDGNLIAVQIDFGVIADPDEDIDDVIETLGEDEEDDEEDEMETD